MEGRWTLETIMRKRGSLEAISAAGTNKRNSGESTGALKRTTEQGDRRRDKKEKGQEEKRGIPTRSARIQHEETRGNR
ncbi:hypothetical protein HDU96_004374 [Phlyctochytrium bullatum]|nr:hypothetical protein HDU96_004374 [Phlyctochytrium bullatum]